MADHVLASDHKHVWVGAVGRGMVHYCDVCENWLTPELADELQARIIKLEEMLTQSELDYRAVMRLHYPLGDAGFCCGLRNLGPGIHEVGCPVGTVIREVGQRATGDGLTAREGE